MRRLSASVHLRTPSARELRAALQAPAPAAPPLSTRLRDLLEARLARSCPSGGPRRRIDAFTVERGGATFTVPFEWSARAARRVLGTAAARAVASGGARDPLSAASDEIDRLCDRAARGLARPGSLATWLTSEPATVRALCAVEAATWAAGLLSLVAPDRAAAGLAIGVADAWHDVPRAAVTLRGRRDAVARAGREGERAALLRVRDGLPGDDSVDGLLTDGLVDALAAPQRPIPARVVGAWPDAGVCLVVDFDDDAVRRAARVVVACAERVAAGTPRALREAAAA